MNTNCKALDAIATLLRHYATELAFPSDPELLSDLVLATAEIYEKDTSIHDTSNRPDTVKKLIAIANELRTIEIKL